MGYPRQLVRRQYRDASRLDARASLHERHGASPHAWQAWVFDQLDVPAEPSILEIGCGPADLWRANQHRLPRGWDVTLSDQSAGMLRDARVRLAGGYGRSFPLAVVDAQALPFGDARFDAVIANHMLYHVPDVDAALAETARVLRRGGQLFAATVGLDHMGELFAVASEASPAAAAAQAPRVASFSLESGGERLARHFDEVRLAMYVNPLDVDHVDPLMDYLLSTETGRSMSPAEQSLCRDRFQSVIDREGAFHITTATGLYVAVAA